MALLMLIIGLVPARSFAQRDGRSAVDFTVGYVGFGDEGIVGHAAVGAGWQWALARRLSIGPELVYMVGPHDDRDLFLTGKAMWSFAPGRYVDPYVVADAGLMLHRATRIDGPFWVKRDGGSIGGGVRVRAARRVSVGFEMRLGWEPHIRSTAVVRVKLGPMGLSRLAGELLRERLPGSPRRTVRSRLQE
jgi:hypothetical protein